MRTQVRRSPRVPTPSLVPTPPLVPKPPRVLAPSRLPAVMRWTGPGRWLVFTLSAASIWCLLSEMYGLCDMRRFFLAILLPATGALYALAALDRVKGDRRLWRAVMIGSLAGFCGAVLYDLFRLPFVFSDAWGMGKLGIPQMPLFKVFPRFGALILAEPMEQGVPAGQSGHAWGAGYSTAAHLLGWFYHFSNGATFGVMFAALYAGAKEAIGAVRVRAWKPILWATLMAVGIELCLLASPYAKFFDIHLTTRFVVVTMLAHIVFGLGLGVSFAWHAARWRLHAPCPAFAA
ncbi:MAG: hypothetical protein IT449_08460 [Phycisphaerales bacterium]|nr:hypothetical protein [Phycisphaerales bacterium]